MGKLQINIPEDLHDKVRGKCLELSTPKKRYSQEKYVLDCIDILANGIKFDPTPNKMYKDVVEQAEETPYWKGDIKTGQMTECKETTTEPKKFKGGYTKEQSVGKKPKRK